MITQKRSVITAVWNKRFISVFDAERQADRYDSMLRHEPWRTDDDKAFLQQEGWKLRKRAREMRISIEASGQRETISTRLIPEHCN